MKIISRIVEFITSTDTTDTEDIPMMRYPKNYTGPKPQHIPPWTLNNRIELLKYRR